MRRLTVHRAFAAAVVLCAAATLWQGLAWYRALAVNQRIAAAEQRVRDGLPADGDDRAALLARALALAKHGDPDAALKAFNTLIPRGPLDEVGRSALYDLGNFYLRQGSNGAAALPMVELAKQRYRDLLRQDPSDWDARYNLERALRLAPEDQASFAEQENVPVERRNVMLRGMGSGDLP